MESFAVAMMQWLLRYCNDDSSILRILNNGGELQIYLVASILSVSVRAGKPFPLICPTKQELFQVRRTDTY